MSMMGNYVMTDESVIKKIQKGECLASDILDDENIYESDDFLDIGKSWHGIHFTLSGEIDEGNPKNLLSQVVLNGQLLCDEDSGYGPPMFLSSQDVQKVNTVLQAVSDDDFAVKYSVSAMQENDIYPFMGFDDLEDHDELEDYMIDFKNIKKFFAQAAEKGKCIIFFLQ